MYVSVKKKTVHVPLRGALSLLGASKVNHVCMLAATIVLALFLAQSSHDTRKFGNRLRRLLIQLQRKPPPKADSAQKAMAAA